jgi:hypothetical protein
MQISAPNLLWLFEWHDLQHIIPPLQEDHRTDSFGSEGYKQFGVVASNLSVTDITRDVLQWFEGVFPDEYRPAF